MSHIDESKPFVPLRIAMLTVSDTRTAATDTSGDVLEDRITKAGHTVAARMILPDDRSALAAQLRAWSLQSDIDAIITTGGTGLTGRDVTIEAHRDIYDKEIEAFGPIFSVISLRTVGTSALQSRATAGIANGTYIFALPGSSGACKDGWDELLSLQLDSRHSPCNLVDIMPRLTER